MIKYPFNTNIPAIKHIMLYNAVDFKLTI